jgi:hypothetical protein
MTTVPTLKILLFAFYLLTMRVVRIARRDGDGKKHKHREDCARYFSVGVFRECGMLQTAVCNFALLLFPFFFFFFFFLERKGKGNGN